MYKKNKFSKNKPKIIQKIVLWLFMVSMAVATLFVFSYMEELCFYIEMPILFADILLLCLLVVEVKLYLLFLSKNEGLSFFRWQFQILGQRDLFLDILFSSVTWNKVPWIERESVVDEWAGEPEKVLDQGLLPEVGTPVQVQDGRVLHRRILKKTKLEEKKTFLSRTGIAHISRLHIHCVLTASWIIWLWRANPHPQPPDESADTWISNQQTCFVWRGANNSRHNLAINKQLTIFFSLCPSSFPGVLLTSSALSRTTSSASSRWPLLRSQRGFSGMMNTMPMNSSKGTANRKKKEKSNGVEITAAKSGNYGN